MPVLAIGTSWSRSSCRTYPIGHQYFPRTQGVREHEPAITISPLNEYCDPRSVDNDRNAMSRRV